MKQQVFVIEGPDCSGKSTLAKELANRLSATLFHATGKRPLYETIGAMTAYHRNILDNTAINVFGLGRPVVLDRHWPSEMCYGPVLRPELHSREEYPWREMASMLQMMGVTYVWCLSEKSIDEHEKHQDIDHPYTREQYASIYDRYLHQYRVSLGYGAGHSVVYDRSKWADNRRGFIEQLLEGQRE